LRKLDTSLIRIEVAQHLPPNPASTPFPETANTVPVEGRIHGRCAWPTQLVDSEAIVLA
jgi:hypothetical protein